jgi:hypothetical protein
MAQPYVEVHRGSADLPVAIERVWAHHCDMESLLAAHPRLHTMSLEAGVMGEVGCVTVVTGEDPKGRVREVRNEVVEATAPSRAVVKTTDAAEPGVTVYTEYHYTPIAARCHLERTVTIQTEPVPAVTRWLISLGARGRRRLAESELQREVREAVAHLGAAR